VTWTKHSPENPPFILFDTVFALFGSNGAFRDVFQLDIAGENFAQQVAFRSYNYGSNFEYDDYEVSRMEANVADLLNTSPRTTNTFGYCQTAMMSELFIYGDVEKIACPLGGRQPVPAEWGVGSKAADKRRNGLSVMDILTVALEMAEALADFHGFSRGVIVHDDVRLGQYLVGKDGKVKINDYNRAELM
jgi:hypothetical protein